MTTSSTRMPPTWADRTLQLLRDGYLFLPRLHWKHRDDVVALRLLGRRALAVFGPAGIEMLYRQPEIEREGAIPARVQKTLFGEGGVQGLDGEDHRHRKDMFMQIMEPESLKVLARATSDTLRRRSREWSRRRSLSLMQAAEDVLMEAGAEWAGVPLARTAVGRRARQMSLMVDSFLALGPRHWRGRLMRWRAEKWVAGLVEQVRSGRLNPPAGSAMSVMSLHRDSRGELLPPRVAAVEILNVIRPLVAVGRFVAFAGLALHENEGRPSNDDDLKRYVHEVRRFYPFVPFIGGRVREDFEWRGVHFPTGALVLADIYGMCHDPALWDEPQRFRPERFQDRPISPYDFVPQGGGDFHRDHRCAGEDATITALMEFTRFLAHDISYEVPPQDLTVDPGRIPTHPADGFRISAIRPRNGSQA